MMGNVSQKFIKGHDFAESGADYVTYGIDHHVFGHTEWGNRIEVYGSSDLRNLIVALLNKHFEEAEA